MKTLPALFSILASFFILTLTAVSINAEPQDIVAKSILKSMSTYIDSQKTIELTFESGIEVITPELEKIQFTSSGRVLLSRPDKLQAHRVSGHADVTLFLTEKRSVFTRKTVMAMYSTTLRAAWIN
jgi:hypothetical protein